jgi:hypothetical protein
LENLEERTLLSTYTISEFKLLGIIPTVAETINGSTSYYYNPSSPFVVNTGGGTNTVNILDTSAGIAINEIGGGHDTVNVGNNGSVQGIVACVTLQNPPDYNTVNVNDSADTTARTMSLFTYSSGGYNWGSIAGLAPGSICFKYNDTSCVNITTGTGNDTDYVMGTGVTTNITNNGHDYVYVGSGGSVQSILGTLSLQNPPSYNVINVEDWSDMSTRTASLSTYSSGGHNWGSITGLAPAAINFKYYDTSSPVNVWTYYGNVTWNVSANAMSNVTGIVVDDNGFPINSVPGEPAADVGYSPAPSSAHLFNSWGPSYLDVEQGQVGDCWLVASLAEVAARDPQDIRNMFTYDGTIVDNGSTVGLYTVRFFDNNGDPVCVQVDTELPWSGSYYDSVQNALGTQCLWVALAEKAYAVANGLGYVTTSNPNQDSYAALNDGWPSWALHAITGQSAAEYSVDPNNIAADWNAGKLIVLCTGNPQSSYIVGSHCYAVVGYDPNAGLPFEVFNPWGTQSNGYAPNTNNTIYGLFVANAPFISDNFAEQSIGSGAIDWNATSNHAGAFSASAQSAQGTVTAVDAWLANYSVDGDNATTFGLKTRRFHG